MNLVNEMMKYIQQMEGWHAGSRSWRNNNPGNIDVGPLSSRRSGNDAAYAVYASMIDGFLDLHDLIEEVIEGHNPTMEEFFAGQRDENGVVKPGGYLGYSPASDPRGKNTPIEYAHYVAAGIGISPYTPLQPLLS